MSNSIKKNTDAFNIMYKDNQTAIKVNTKNNADI